MENGTHVSRAELGAVVRELRLTIIVSTFAAQAVISVFSPAAAGVAAGLAAFAWKGIPFLAHLLR